MRIISGTHKSRQFHIPKNLKIRPTTDFAKEALFNILQHKNLFSDEKAEGIMALDLFSGSGSISYEFASRGCREIVAVEKNRSCCRFIKETAARFNFHNIHVINMDVFTYLKSCSALFDIIFADPPFKLKNIERIPTLIFEKNLLKENGLLIVEHSSEVNLAQQKHFMEKRGYGTVNFSIFTLKKLEIRN